MNEQLTANIILTDQDARLYEQFCKHYNTFKTLVDSGVFEVKDGQAVIIFDHDGVLKDINVTSKVYTRVKVNIHI